MCYSKDFACRAHRKARLSSRFFSLLGLALLCIWGLLPGSAQAASSELSPRERAVVVEAQQALQQGKAQEAEAILTEYLEVREERASSVFYLVLGNCHYEQREMVEARRAFTKGLAQSPEHGMLHANLAAASYSLKRYAEAALHFEKAYASSKEPSPEMLYHAGVAYFQGKKHERSQAVLEKLIRESGEVRTEWAEVLTYALIRQDKWDRARRTILDLLNRSPAERRYWKLLAQVHLQQKAYREAASALEIAYRIRPPDPSGWRELSDIYAYVGAPLQAAEALKRSFGEAPEANDWSELARLFARGYRYEQAISCLDRALERKGTAALFEEKGRMCYAAGRYEEAIRAMQSAAAKDSRRGEPYLWVGYAACQLLDWDLAHEAFSEAERFNACQKRAEHGMESVRSILQAKQSIPGSSQASS